MTDRCANACFFGIDFQINAGIVLMIEHIKNATFIRMESDKEDIEIELNNKHSILAQAKSVVKASTDFKNVLEKLKKALLSLSEGASKCNADKLIYITNSPSPFNDKDMNTIFALHAHRSFDSLPQKAKDIILQNTPQNSKFIPEHFFIQVLPFESDDEKERYKFVKQTIDDFIGQLNLSTPGLCLKFHDALSNSIFRNGSQHNLNIKISKQQFIWPLIVIETDIKRCDNKILELIDESLHDEILDKYKDIINDHCEKFEFVTKVLSDYLLFKENNKERNTNNINFFIDSIWENYIDNISVPGMNHEIEEGLIKFILYSIIKRRITIQSIKEYTNL